MQTLVCIICKEEIKSNIIADSDLGTVLVKLANHCNQIHKEQYNEYAKALALLLQSLPAYLLIEHFVDIEKTSEVNKVSGDLVLKAQQLVSDVLGQAIEPIG